MDHVSRVGTRGVAVVALAVAQRITPGDRLPHDDRVFLRRRRQPPGGALERLRAGPSSRSPSPPAEVRPGFWGIACPAATSCFAVGWWQDPSSGATKTLVDHWDGAVWSIQTSPNPVGEKNLFRSVSCPSPTSCFAVGENQSGSTQTTLIEHWNGTAWTVQVVRIRPVPRPRCSGGCVPEHYELFRNRLPRLALEPHPVR